jgi:NADH dehydrogenase
MSDTPHVVIVGAGFGGLGVAEQLAHVTVNVTLIDRHNYHTFQPLLYQVATSLLNAEDVGAPGPPASSSGGRGPRETDH